MFQAGDYDTTETVVLPINSFSSNDPAESVTITNLAAADVEIHKDGSTTQRASDNGVSVSIDFDTVTGNHIVAIVLSDNSDAGYYADGSRFQVRMEGTTIDGATVNAWIGVFSIGCVLRPTTAGRKLDVNATGEAGLDLDNTSGTIDAAQLGADCITSAKIADDAISAEHINTGAFTADAFAADALVAATFATGAFTADAFAASSLDGKGNWNVAKTGYTLTNLSDANAGKVSNIVDGVGVDVKFTQVLIDSDDADGAVNIANSNGPGVQYATTGDAVNTANKDIDLGSGSFLGISAANWGKLGNIVDGVGVDVKFTQVLIDSDDADGAINIANSNGPGVQYATTGDAVNTGNKDIDLGSGALVGDITGTLTTVTDVTNGVTLATAEDVYHADAWFTRDEANTQDEYTVQWFKNGVPVTSGITLPKIQVVNRSDGSDLIAEVAMTQIGTTGAYKYDEATNRQSSGEAVLVIVTATIDASSRAWRCPTSRDSTA